MIACVFGPDGIVVTSSVNDFYREVKEVDNQNITTPIIIPGHPHVHNFWNKIVLTYNFMTPNSYDSSFIAKLCDLENQWSEVPNVVDFMPYLKKLLVDNNYQIIGITSAYEKEGTRFIPFVYQILGNDIRRINMDSKGNLTYSYACLERIPSIWRLLQRVKIQNGDDWEEANEIHLRCDLFSIEKSIDFCCFLIKTSEYINNINSSIFRNPTIADIVVHNPSNIELNKLTI